ncbi:phosphoethanolamine transferase [Litchfieldella qijiaojingensis]|uniref:Phosphoethanolamine transferase n=1 Tax=Litchfieldella qijiaojingensis TaxID=980347 RepID=A0ABQ2YKI1_9GAMM|nr:phosphoethanolamine--lipid A transferase [Halomonas qijiaojingensis]GGX85914.1 phosphoethanolamine transferase [Halomonas qijiaojingensis]
MSNRFFASDHWLARHCRFSFTLSPEALTLLVCLAFTLFYNLAFWRGVLGDQSLLTLSTWGRLASDALVLTSLQFVVFVLCVTRFSVKVVLTVLVWIAASVSYFTHYYGTYFNTDMIVNILQTDRQEAAELLTPRFVVHMLAFGVLPTLLLWRVRLVECGWKKAIGRKLAYLAGGIVVLGISLMLSYQSLSSLMRNNTELRYLVTPGNYLVSMGQVLAASDPPPSERLAIGEDATLAPVRGNKPLLLVMVVGESVRATNWGLNGYERQTTPRLAARDVINFSDVSSCGTSTAVSVPCMFSPVGKSDYDKRYIQSHESLLDVLKHAGFQVLWVDNQSGCKGVCDEVVSLSPSPKDYPELCSQGRCLDGALLEEVKKQADNLKGNTVIVLHQLGNHGPSYYRRYPATFRAFTPTCDSADLTQCSRQSIVNSYDDAVLYTDALLDGIIAYLDSQQHHAPALLYVSDHGESLGEHGIYLHGIPYSIAPSEQTKVPMVWWSSPTFDQSVGLDHGCLEARTDLPLSHDNLFHSVLGVLGVKSQVVQAERDITHDCRHASQSS